MLLVLAAVVLDAAVQITVILGQHRIYQLDSTARARLNSAYVATFFVGGAAGSQISAIVLTTRAAGRRSRPSVRPCPWQRSCSGSSPSLPDRRAQPKSRATLDGQTR